MGGRVTTGRERGEQWSWETWVKASGAKRAGGRFPPREFDAMPGSLPASPAEQAVSCHALYCTWRGAAGWRFPGERPFSRSAPGHVQVLPTLSEHEPGRRWAGSSLQTDVRACPQPFCSRQQVRQTPGYTARGVFPSPGRLPLARSSTVQLSLFLGRVTVKIEPFPWSLSTLTIPPWPLTISATI